jgi:hypothetical protein
MTEESSFGMEHEIIFFIFIPVNISHTLGLCLKSIV